MQNLLRVMHISAPVPPPPCREVRLTPVCQTVQSTAGLAAAPAGYFAEVGQARRTTSALRIYPRSPQSQSSRDASCQSSQGR